LTLKVPLIFYFYNGQLTEQRQTLNYFLLPTIKAAGQNIHHFRP